MSKPNEQYQSIALTKIKEKPIGIAKFKEPVFKLGKFQDRYIEVDVHVYPLSFADAHGKEMVGVRFGEMSVLRFVDRTLLYDLRSLESE